ncbi:MAG: tRNA (5-methylaminomethyl-2-thiouridine)(34)-methyltransferase MnmD [Nereida ignava]|jgi:tRNA U34 5-methylaminomethyl-2-thiouridine-forming methyltransferase MnmC|uniref:tRNA (5-methylaminomethyl-2-thiouridine)(34)-methyltransferase MnmD n=1 Tax=Nereida ignava TaxID=282199 RepID=UPI0030FA7178
MDQSHGDLEWQDGTPIARRFDDPYYSLQDGLAETRFVFHDGNQLTERFADGFQIAELGFGTGLSFLATWDAWRKSAYKGTLHFTSFEAFPLSTGDTRAALAPFTELAPLTERLLEFLAGKALPSDIQLTIIEGDARETVPNWQGQADAWFLDGFSPAKNPELWSADLMTAVGDHTKRGGTFATYTAAGHVRQKLSDAGFTVERISGFGRKRHMSVGKR